MNIKKPIIATAALAVVSLASIGGVAAAHATTNSDSSNGTSIIDKLVTKFNLNADEVKAVFDEDRSAHEAERRANQAERLATAVTDGDLTQEQADYITKALAEIDTLRGDSIPEDEDDTVREQIKEKMDALRTWAEDNDVDMKFIGHGGGHHGGFGGPRGEKSPDTNSDSTE
jgi:polyhydroxyalkanoate synthesis regulator phasin